MSYIIFDESTGLIISVSYKVPNPKTKYIPVSDKVANDFLSGTVPTTQYRVLKSKLSSLYRLMPRDAKPSLGLFDFFVQPFRQRMLGTFYYRRILPLNQIVDKWVASNITSPLYKFSLEVAGKGKHVFHTLRRVKNIDPKKYAKKIYYFCKEAFSPYGSFPGEYYIYKAIGYAPANKMLFQVDNIHNLKNLCVAPWVHLHTWPNNKVLPCCLTPMDATIGDLTENSLAEVWNGQPLRDMRVEFMNDKRPKSCYRCWNIEDAGGSSYRHHLNKTFTHDFDLIKSTKEDGHVDKVNIKYWDFRFSNICNFKCRTCGPQLSSGWYEDTEKLYGALPKDLPDPQHVKTKPTWAELSPLFDIVEEIYFAGGEPLIMEEHYRILNKLVEMGKVNTALSYNTNFSRLKYKKLDVLDIWPKFNNVKVGASIDAMGQRAEYMRSGTKWDRIVDNRNQMKIKCPNADFFTNITLGVFNCFHILDFYKWIVDSGFISNPYDIHINLVQFPKHYSLQALPIEIKQELTPLYLDIADYCENNKVDRIPDQFRMAATYMNEQDIWEQEKNNFVNITKSIDDIRDEKFVEVFPELERLMQ